MATIIYPPVLGTVGERIHPRSEDYIEGHEIGESRPYAAAGLAPMGWNTRQSRGFDGSRMVGWTVHHKGHAPIVSEHAFSINPQAITRSPSARNQMQATQGGFYVDDFGEGSELIQVSQFVAHGRGTKAAGGSLYRSTMRDDVIRWYDQIYTRVAASPGLYDVYFHDNHFWANLTARVPERVYFPQQAVQILRSVQQHNVWQLQITMGTLDAPPSAVGSGLPTPHRPHFRVHIVKHGETLKKIAHRLAGRHATHRRVLHLERQIIALTLKYESDDIRKNRRIQVYSTDSPNRVVNTAKVKRMHLHRGEKIILPAG